jgi:predicted dehydrogenase
MAPSFIQRIFRFLGWSEHASKSSSALRIGILGAANIAPPALIKPALYNQDVIISAIAARDGKRAEAYAKKHKIARWFNSYEQLIEDPDIDAIYIPAPNGLHYKWAVKALEAGKHVLCEKPVTSNAKEAEELASIALKHKRVLMEAAHSFHHPALIRAREIIRSGEIGDIVEVSASFGFPFMPSSDIRFNVNGTQPKLAGGSMMDAGVYASHCVRFLTDAKFASCKSARAVERFPGVDETMDATVEFENSPIIGKIHSNMAMPFPWLPKMSATVVGTKGSVYVFNFLAPFVYHYIQVKVQTPKGSVHTRTEKEYGEHGKSTYEHQLESFVYAVRNQPEGGIARTPSGGTVDDPVGTMKMIDGIYEKSGLGIRHGYEL